MIIYILTNRTHWSCLRDEFTGKNYRIYIRHEKMDYRLVFVYPNILWRVEKTKHFEKPIWKRLIGIDIGERNKLNGIYKLERAAVDVSVVFIDLNRKIIQWTENMKLIGRIYLWNCSERSGAANMLISYQKFKCQLIVTSACSRMHR